MIVACRTGPCAAAATEDILWRVHSVRDGFQARNLATEAIVSIRRIRMHPYMICADAEGVNHEWRVRESCRARALIVADAEGVNHEWRVRKSCRARDPIVADVGDVNRGWRIRES